MSEQNKRLVRHAIEEVWNKGNYDAVDQLVSSDFVIHGSQGDIHGPAGTKQSFRALRTAFPDLHFRIEDQFAEGDRVVTRWTATGSHLGAFQGVPATGKRVNMAGTDIDHLANGKIVECWTNVNDLGLLQQLGVVPSTEEAAR